MTTDPNAPRTVPAVPPRTLLLLAALTAVACLLRLPLLGDPVWFDEACMSNQRLGTWAQLAAVIYVDVHPPLFTTFMHCWNGLFGDGEVAMRMPALLTGLVSVPLTFAVGRRLVGDGGALWAAALLALSPTAIWYSAEARLYAPMMCCVLLAVWTFQRVVDGGPRVPRWLWALHLGNVAVMLALHYYLALYVVLLALLAPIATRGIGGRAGKLLLWHGIGLVLLAGYVLVKQRIGEFETSQDYLRAMTPDALYELLFRWGFTGNALRAGDSTVTAGAAWAQEGLGVALVALGLFEVVRRVRARPLGPFLVLYVLLVPGFLFACVQLGYQSTYIERSCLPALPFLFLLVGAGLASLPRTLHRAGGALTLLLATASLVAFFQYRQTQWTVYKPDPDWRAAAAWLGDEIDGGASGRPVFTSMAYPRSLPYYDARIQYERGLLPGTDPDAIGAKVGRRVGSWLGGLAAATFRSYDEHNARLLAAAKLRIFNSRSDPDQLQLAARLRAGDDVCYLVRNVWHPHVNRDSSIEDLLANPRCTVLQTAEFTGVTVYKVSIAR